MGMALRIFSTLSFNVELGNKSAHYINKKAFEKIHSKKYQWQSIAHSDLKLFIGLTIAPLMAWKLTVASAIRMAIAPARPNIHHSICIR